MLYSHSQPFAPPPMRPDPEDFRSAFISQNRAAANRGSFSSFLSGSSPSDGFAAGMQSSLAPPQGTNRRSQQAYAQAGADTLIRFIQNFKVED